MRIAFDIGGVISKYPEKFRALIKALGAGHVEVFVISDMRRDEIIQVLQLNDILIHHANVYSADYDTHGEGCKAELLRELKIDLFFDDFLGYVAIPSDTVQCLVMPNPYKPYCADTWKSLPGTPEFGRRVYKKSPSVLDEMITKLEAKPDAVAPSVDLPQTLVDALLDPGDFVDHGVDYKHGDPEPTPDSVEHAEWRAAQEDNRDE